MAKKKTTPVWLTVLEGTVLALGVYMGVLLVVALLLVKGVVGESLALPLLAVDCGAAVLGGALFAAGRTATLGALPCALCVCGGFVAVLLVVGLGVYGQLAVTGGGGVLLLTAVGAALAAGLLAGKRRHKRSRARKL